MTCDLSPETCYLLFMPFYLGIDGGGTKTRCALGDESHVLATAMTGGSNMIRLGETRAREALHAALRDVCAAANISPDQIRGICVGASGAGRPEVVAAIRAILAELTPATIQVVGDTVTTLEAAFGSGPGIVTISGTGSIVYGRDVAGKTVRAGGWGFAVSDEGSGQWIGRRAVSTILHAHDAGLDTSLAQAVLNEWNLNSLDELVHTANSTPPPEFPRLFPVVLHVADGGDSMARSLLESAGAELARLTDMVIRRLVPRPPHAPIAISGSVFRQSALVREVFYNTLQRTFSGLDLRRELVEPVDGALALARIGGAPGTG